MFNFINIKPAADNVIKRPTESTEPITTHMHGQCKLVCVAGAYPYIYSFIFYVSVVSRLRFLCQNNALNPYLKRREPLSHTNSINAVYCFCLPVLDHYSARVGVVRTQTHVLYVCTLQSSRTLSSTLSWITIIILAACCCSVEQRCATSFPLLIHTCNSRIFCQ